MSYKSARKWKNAQFDKLLNTCEMMSVNNINSELIKYYNDQQYKDIMNKYNIINKQLFPEISRFDPVAKVICLRPGQICHIIRPSKTAIQANYYRICV